MGQESSTLSSFEGLQLSRVQHASPAFEAGLVPYFDFIVGVDTVSLDADNYSFFYEYVKKSENKPLKLRVFNIRNRVEREVTVTPRDWSGDRKNGLMGFNVSWESAEKAIESTWHITNVQSASPAARADLMATRDYLLGMQLPADNHTMTVFKDSSEFHTRLEEWRMVQEAIAIQKPDSKCNLLLIVFDSIANEVKEIVVETSAPNESLGIEVANGYLHVVPPTPGSTSLPRLTRCVVTNPSLVLNANNNNNNNNQVPSKPDFEHDHVKHAQPHFNSATAGQHSEGDSESTSPFTQQQNIAPASLPNFPQQPQHNSHNNHHYQQHQPAPSLPSLGSLSGSSNNSFPQPPPPTPSIFNQQHTTSTNITPVNAHQINSINNNANRTTAATGNNNNNPNTMMMMRTNVLPAGQPLPPPPTSSYTNINNPAVRPPTTMMNSLPAFSAPSLPPPPKF